jgi:hypothetical protein
MGVPTIRTTTTTNNTGGNFLISNPHGNHWGGAIGQSEALRIYDTNPPQLEVKGKMTLNGRDLEERLETIEKVLQIPERDLEIEKQYPKLKKMYNDYIKELSKLRMWEELKK